MGSAAIRPALAFGIIAGTDLCVALANCDAYMASGDIRLIGRGTATLRQPREPSRADTD